MKNIFKTLLTIAVFALPAYISAQVTVDVNGKLTVASPTGTSNFLSLSAGDVYDLDLQAGDLVFRPNGNTADGTYALKLSDNTGFTGTFYGKVNLGAEQTGIILEADGAEALWYTTDHYSWGFGKNWNYFADEIMIGNSGSSSFTPLNSDGLSIDANKDIRMEGTGTKYIRFTESGLQKGFMGHTGTNMFVRNDETGGDLYLDAEVDLYLQTGATTRMTIEEDGQIGIGITNPTNGMHHYIGNGARTAAHPSILDHVIEDNAQAYLGLDGGLYAGVMFSDETSSTYGGITFDQTNNEVELRNGNSTRMVVESNGRIGMGTEAPLSDLHIADAGEVAGIIVERTDASNYVNLLSGTTGNSFYYARAKRFSIIPSSSVTSTAPNIPNGWFQYGPSWPTAAQAGNIGFGKDNPTEKFDVAGNIKCVTLMETSDRRLKKDINEYDLGLEAVMQLNPVTFKYNERSGLDTDELQTGVIAQELQQIAPELVEEFVDVEYAYDEEGTQTYVGEETYLQVRSSEIKWMMVNAIQEQQKQISERDEQIETLVTKNEELEARLAKIEALIANGGLSANTDEKLNLEQDVVLNGSGNVAELAQNQPNPFNENTVIKYFLPEGSTGAQMNIFSSEGKLLKAVPINQIGAGQINLQANSLPTGNYMYQLVTDSGVVGSKTMVLVK